MNDVISSEDIIENITNLVELDYDAIAAYTAAIDRLQNQSYKNKLIEFRSDHQTHIQVLSAIIRTHGGTPPSEGDAKKLLTKGKVVIADLGNDETILKAMKSNEDQTNSEYEKAANESYPIDIQLSLQNALQDERRHRAWIEGKLKAGT